MVLVENVFKRSKDYLAHFKVFRWENQSTHDRTNTWGILFPILVKTKGGSSVKKYELLKFLVGC